MTMRAVCLLIACVYAGFAGTSEAETYLVLPDGTGDFPTIRAAVESSGDGDIIELGDGVFTGEGNRNVSYMGKPITIRSQSDDPELCIIDCEALGRGFLFQQQEDTLSVLRSVTIRNGLVTGAYPGSAGGGILTDMADPLIERCMVTDCRADYGGGIAIDTYLQPGPIVRDCTIVRNEAVIRGGGIDVHQSHPRIIRTTVADNAAPVGGGVALHMTSHPEISHCILAYSAQGEGISGSGATILCTNIYGNAYADWTGYESQLGVNGNISQPPLFCDLETGDYRLQEASPCAPDANPACGQMGAWPVGCETRPAVCCLGPMCELMLPADCALAGGEFRETELTCDPNPCESALLVVAPDGTGDYPTIQAAIVAAEDGDVVELLDGTYTGDGNRDLDFYGKAITVRSQSGNPYDCILDVEGTLEDPHRAVFFHYGVGPETVLEGVTITNGFAAVPDAGGGIRSITASTCPTVRHCVFTNNQSVNPGGAIKCDGGALRLIDCVFKQNDSGDGSAIEIQGVEQMEIRGCVFREHAGSRGAAVKCWDSNPHFIDCHFESNHAYDGGGAIWFQDGCQAVLEACSFLANHADGKGGAVSHWSGELALLGCEFRDNTAGQGAGALRTRSTAATLEGCHFEENSAPNGGAVRFEHSGQVLANACTFVNNTASEHGGALLGYYHEDLIDLAECAFLGNTAVIDGGAIFSGHSNLIMWRCTVADNDAPIGSGIFTAGEYADLDMHNCLVTENLGGEGVGVRDDTSANLICCDLYGNEGGNWVGSIAVLLGIQGNIEEDPLLCGEIAPEHPYTLQEASPCAEENNPECGQIGAYGVGCTDTISGQTPETRLLTSLRITPVPLRGTGRIEYQVPPELADRPLHLALYDAGGRKVTTLARGQHRSGAHTVELGPGSLGSGRLSSGIYFVRLAADGVGLDRRLVVLE